MLHGSDGTSSREVTPEAGPPVKRQRRSSTAERACQHPVEPPIAQAGNMWAALAEVYSALGEQNLVHVSFAKHIARWA